MSRASPGFWAPRRGKEEPIGVVAPRDRTKEGVMGQQVKEIMTERPITLDKGASLADAARLMRDRGIGDVIVVEGESAEGIVTDRDIVIRGIAEGADPNTTSLGQVVTG